MVINPPYPIRSRAEPTPPPSFATYREPCGAKWKYTPRKIVPSVYSADVPRSSAIYYPGHQDPYAAGPSYVRRELGESSRGIQRPAYEPYHSQGPGETLGEIRYQIAQLEARAASVDEIYGPLIPASSCTAYISGSLNRIAIDSRLFILPPRRRRRGYGPGRTGNGKVLRSRPPVV